MSSRRSLSPNNPFASLDPELRPDGNNSTLESVEHQGLSPRTANRLNDFAQHVLDRSSSSAAGPSHQSQPIIHSHSHQDPHPHQHPHHHDHDPDAENLLAFSGEETFLRTSDQFEKLLDAQRRTEEEEQEAAALAAVAAADHHHQRNHHHHHSHSHDHHDHHDPHDMMLHGGSSDQEYGLDVFNGTTAMVGMEGIDGGGGGEPRRSGRKRRKPNDTQGNTGRVTQTRINGHVMAQDVDPADIARAKKNSHREVERRRRENIHEGIISLGQMIPNGEAAQLDKGSTLKRAAEYLGEMQLKVDTIDQERAKWAQERDDTNRELLRLQTALQEEHSRSIRFETTWREAEDRAAASQFELERLKAEIEYLRSQ